MDQIVSKEMIRAKARSAYARGKGRDDHGMNPGAPAIAEWQNEWDRLERVMRRQAEVVVMEI